MSTLSTLPHLNCRTAGAKSFTGPGASPCCLLPAACCLPPQINPAIGELALAYIRFGIRPAR